MLTECKTSLRFCGVNFILEDLEDYEFIQLFDAVVDHGSDLVERASNMSAHAYALHREKHLKQLAENSQHIVLLDKEAERRKSLPTSTGPVVCPACVGLHDPSDLCEACQEAYNEFEQRLFEVAGV